MLYKYDRSRLLTSLVIAFALIAAACGGSSSDAGSSADGQGEVDSGDGIVAGNDGGDESNGSDDNGGADSSTDAQQGNATYCQDFAEVTQNPDDVPEDGGVVDLLIPVIEDVSANGPQENAEELSDFAASLRNARAIQRGEEPEGGLFEVTDQAEVLGRSDEIIETFLAIILADCPGSEGGVALLRGESASTTEVAVIAREDVPIAGPIGQEISVGAVSVRIDSAILSNVDPEYWFDDTQTEGTDDLNLFVDFAMTNNDPNSQNLVPIGDPSLFIDGESTEFWVRPEGEVLSVLEANESGSQTIVFYVPDDVVLPLTLERLAVGLGDRSAPTRIEFDPAVAPEATAGPVTGTISGSPVAYEAGNPCVFPHTVSLDSATFSTEAPVEVSIDNLLPRSDGSQWMFLEGTVSSLSTSECSAASSFFSTLIIPGNIVLELDGETPFFVEIQPNETLEPGEAIDFQFLVPVEDDVASIQLLIGDETSPGIIEVGRS